MRLNNGLFTGLLLVLATACAGRTKQADKASSTMPSEPKNDMPIACRPQALTKAERERSQSLRTELAAATKKTSPIADGYVFEYAPDSALFQKAAEWISLERRCCPFLAFDLRWAQGDATPPRLSITGPEGTKDFLAAEMPELPHGG